MLDMLTDAERAELEAIKASARKRLSAIQERQRLRRVPVLTTVYELSWAFETAFVNAKLKARQ